jgi:hypothetical protein
VNRASANSTIIVTPVDGVIRGSVCRYLSDKGIAVVLNFEAQDSYWRQVLHFSEVLDDMAS